MPLLNYGGTLVAGTNENVNDVQARLDEIRAIVNALDDENFDAGGTPLDYAKLALSGSIVEGDLATALRNRILVSDADASAGEVSAATSDWSEPGGSVSITMPGAGVVVIIGELEGATTTGAGQGVQVGVSRTGRILSGAPDSEDTLVTALVAYDDRPSLFVTAAFVSSGLFEADLAVAGGGVDFPKTKNRKLAVIGMVAT